eukprot:11804837-Karenia_brevis.AAC.1
MFNLAVAQIGLAKFGLISYQARHGGANRDAMLKRLEMEAIRKRGRLKTYQSLRRYEKHGRRQLVYNQTPAATEKWCDLVITKLERVLHGRQSQIPQPPFV